MSHDCLHCHGVVDKVVGPPYLDISKRYIGDNNIKPILIDKIKNGGGGLWYGGVMSGHPLIKNEEIESMVDWILSIDSLENIKLLSNSKVKFDILRFGYSKELKSFDVLDSTLVMSSEQKEIKTDELIQTLKPKKYEVVQLQANIEISELAKYIFRLKGSTPAQLSIDKKTSISIKEHDQEAVAELKEGKHTLTLTFQQIDSEEKVELLYLSGKTQQFTTIPMFLN